MHLPSDPLTALNANTLQSVPTGYVRILLCII